MLEQKVVIEASIDGFSSAMRTVGFLEGFPLSSGRRATSRTGCRPRSAGSMTSWSTACSSSSPPRSLLARPNRARLWTSLQAAASSQSAPSKRPPMSRARETYAQLAARHSREDCAVMAELVGKVDDEGFGALGRKRVQLSRVLFELGQE